MDLRGVLFIKKKQGKQVNKYWCWSASLNIKTTKKAKDIDHAQNWIFDFCSSKNIDDRDAD